MKDLFSFSKIPMNGYHFFQTIQCPPKSSRIKAVKKKRGGGEILVVHIRNSPNFIVSPLKRLRTSVNLAGND